MSNPPEARRHGCIPRITEPNEERVVCLNAAALTDKRMLTISLSASHMHPFRTLVDSGSTDCYLDYVLAARYRLAKKPLAKPLQLHLFDGSLAGSITEYVTLNVRFPTGKRMYIDFLLTKLDPSCSAVLGHNWLVQTNPTIDWKSGHIELDSALRELANPLQENANATDSLTASVGDMSSAKASKAKAKVAEGGSIDVRIIGAAAFAMLSKKSPASVLRIRPDLSWARSVSANPAAESGENIPPCYHDFLDVFSSTKAQRLPKPTKHDLKIDLTGDEKVPLGTVYPLSEAELEILREYVQDNLAKGHIRPASSPGGAPVFFIRKPDGSGLRLCVDYRGLNRITRRDKYPIPLIAGAIDRLRSAKLFTKLDLRVGYSNLRIAEGDEWKTAFRTRFGTYEYCVVPFGLANAPAAFQRYMNHIFADLLDVSVLVYLDDILIFSDDPSKHEEHVKEVLRRLRANDLYCKPEKCEFHATTIEYLGFIVSPNGIFMDARKVETITTWPEPKRVKEVQSFLGFANFYRRFILNFSDLAKPLTRLTKKHAKWNFDDKCRQAFDALKTAFTSAPVLHHYDPNLPLVVETDASDYAISAILSTVTPSQELHPIAFHSRSLAPAELNYDVHDKELLAIFEAFTIWRHYLEFTKHQVDVITDHKNLEYFSTTKLLSRRQYRWSEYLSPFNMVIRFRPGKLGAKPDALTRRSDVYPKRGDSDFATANPQNLRAIFDQSHLSASMAATAFEFVFLRASEIMDYESLRTDIVNALTSDPLAKSITAKLSGNDPPSDWNLVDNGLLTHYDQIYVPDAKDLRLRVLQSKHDHATAGHPGRAKTCTLVARDFYWPKLRSYVVDYVKSCVPCSRNKAKRHKPYGLLKPLPVPERPWHSISMDFIEQLPASDSYTAILVVIDRLTKQAVFIPTTDKVTSEDLAQLFLVNVFSKHGVPSHVSSDRGSEFVSHFFRSLGTVLDMKLHYTSGHHPEANGQAEVTNQTLEQYLRFYTNYQQTNWASLLPLAEFAYNNAPHSAIGVSPFFANKGYDPAIAIHPEREVAALHARDLAVELHELQEVLKRQIKLAQEDYSRYANRRRMPPPEFKLGEKVFISAEFLKTTRPTKKLAEKYLGPFPLIAKVSEVSFTVKLPDYLRTVHPVFHVSQLEKAHPNTIPNRVEEPPAPVVIDEALEYEVAEILDSKIDRRLRCRLKYYIRWAGYENTDEEFSWVNATDIQNATELIEAFHAQHPARPGSFAEFRQAIKAA